MVKEIKEKKKKEEKEKEKKNKKTSNENVVKDNSSTNELLMEEEEVLQNKKKKEDKHNERKQKRQRQDDDDKDEESHETEANEKGGIKNQDQEEKKVNQDDNDMIVKNSKKYKVRRLERQGLLEQVPTIDPDTGVAYTKQQIRRMKKRIQKGLHPIETPSEIQERLRNERELKRMEEQELAGILYQNESSKITKDDNSDNDTNEEDAEENDNDHEDMDEKRKTGDEKEGVDDDDDSNNDEETKYSYEKKKGDTSSSSNNNNNINIKPTYIVRTRPPRHEKKPVPKDYICSACQNKNQPIHWIYDCPNKERKNKQKGSTSAEGGSTTTKGVLDPDQRKVFVSGLPFDVKTKDVIEIFTTHLQQQQQDKDQQQAQPHTILKCKLIRFPDTGRCTGQAYLTFEKESDAVHALQLSGTKLNHDRNTHTTTTTTTNNTSKEGGEGKKGSSSTTKDKQHHSLELKVSKCMNRYDARRKKRNQ